jgi:Glycosyl transferase family 2
MVRLFMDSPRYTVIIPMARFCADEPVLANLRETPPPNGGLQILVAEGHHPARQRNATLELAKGEILVFLDNDCALGADYWKELETALNRPGVDIVGGPAMLRPQATGWEKIFHALLTHVLVVGTISSRYAPRGEFRVATQTDLILCNLAARRTVFEKIGPLSIKLFPNEENEWLDRARLAGIGAFYDPELRVFRPQRTTPRQMALTLLRYGIGRTRQFQVSGWRLTFHQFLPVMAVLAFAALVQWRLEVEFIILWLIASAIIAFSCDSVLNLWQRIVAGLIAPLIPLLFATGQVIGWIALFLPRRKPSLDISVVNERGEPVH